MLKTPIGVSFLESNDTIINGQFSIIYDTYCEQRKTKHPREQMGLFKDTQTMVSTDRN